MISSVAILMLNIIALIAILVARSELRKAFREIKRFSSERTSARAAADKVLFLSSCSNQFSANSLSVGPQARSESFNRTSSTPSASSFALKTSPMVGDIQIILNAI